MLTENMQSTDRVGAEYKYKCNTRLESRAKCTALESIHSGVDIVPPTSCLEPILTNSTSEDDGDDVDGGVVDNIDHHQGFVQHIHQAKNISLYFPMLGWQVTLAGPAFPNVEIIVCA